MIRVNPKTIEFFDIKKRGSDAFVGKNLYLSIEHVYRKGASYVREVNQIVVEIFNL